MVDIRACHSKKGLIVCDEGKRKAPEKGRLRGQTERLGSALILKRVARRYDQVESGVFVPILGLGGAEESADLDRGSLLHEVLRDGGVLGAGLGEHDGVHEERLLAGAEVVGDGEAGDFPVLPFEVTGIGGEATREVEAVDGFHGFDC